MVVTDFPLASKVRSLHELIGWPSTRTVQAPQTSDSQERFVPVSFRRYRKKSKRTSSAGTFPFHGLALTVNSISKLCSVAMGASGSAIISPFHCFGWLGSAPCSEAPPPCKFYSQPNREDRLPALTCL